MSSLKDLRAKLDHAVETYGSVALGVFLALFVLTLASFWALIQTGLDVASVFGTAGAGLGAYGLTKLTLPFRIVATLALTPPVHRVLQRLRGAPGPVEAETRSPDPTSAGTP